jgi:DNA-binding NtrC family response regulator
LTGRVTANLPKSQVLVVEDNEQIRELVAAVLEHAGYQVQVAENGAEALDRVREACPQLIVLDLMMPVLNGWEFLEVTNSGRLMCVDVDRRDVSIPRHGDSTSGENAANGARDAAQTVRSQRSACHR